MILAFDHMEEYLELLYSRAGSNQRQIAILDYAVAWAELMELNLKKGLSGLTLDMIIRTSQQAEKKIFYPTAIDSKMRRQAAFYLYQLWYLGDDLKEKLQKVFSLFF